MNIEHLLPQSSHVQEQSEYDNCVYACCLCNRARSNEPVVDTKGRRLLDPTKIAWSERFVATGEHLECCSPDDHDAHYTLTTYDLNDELKVRRRARRAERVGDGLQTLLELPLLIDGLLDMAGRASGTDRTKLLEAIARLRNTVVRAKDILADYPAVPDDLDPRCRCGSNSHHCLPEWLEVQTAELAT